MSGECVSIEESARVHDYDTLPGKSVSMSPSSSAIIMA